MNEWGQDYVAVYNNHGIENGLIRKGLTSDVQ